MRARVALFLGLALLLAGVSPVHGGLADKLKKKAEKKADETVDKTLGTEESAENSGATPDEKESTAGDPAVKGSGSIGAVSTKFDFIPGDRVLFADDFTQDELGEFPTRWKLELGTFEVAEMDGERWLRCISDDGRIRMKLPGALPERWTLEFDFYCADPSGQALTVSGMNDKDGVSWESGFPQAQNVIFRSGSVFSSTPLEGKVPGRHHVMLLARGPALKVYFDRQRVSNAPDAHAANGLPVEFEFRLWTNRQPMIGNVRFAEGPTPPPDLLAGGKLVTHGIRFKTGSDVVEPESAPILRQVAAWMTKNEAAKVSITGHTDNVGTAASNLDLSKRRAASVAKVLAADFAIAADRFSTDGKGDSAPMAPNATTEGRSMNRRVEFAKL